MAQGTVRLKGLKEFQRDLNKMDKDTAKLVKAELKDAADIVRVEAIQRFSGVSARTAAGFRTVVRQRGVAVEQRKGRTTGLRPDWGRLQMRRALEPALEHKTDEVLHRVERAFDRLADRNGW